MVVVGLKKGEIVARKRLTSERGVTPPRAIPKNLPT